MGRLRGREVSYTENKKKGRISLIRFLLVGLLLAIRSAPLAAAEQGQLDASRALFSVLAAVNVAGYDADLDSPSNHPMRAQIRAELASKNIPSVPDLKRFFDEHRQKDWTAELSQYVSYALVVDGPSAFNFRLKTNELPPDVARLEGLTPLIVRFEREANLEALWQKAQPAFEEVIARYHEPVTRAVAEVNGYLRHVTTASSGRRFQIYVDILGGPNQIQSRSYANEYFVVVTPSPEVQVEDIRHAYLHHLLDPMAGRYSEELMKKKALGDYALGAPFLEEFYKQDFFLLATESLIKAVEARLQRGAAAKQQYVTQALEDGFILTPHFAEQLPVFEAQEQAMRLYFLELIKTIDLRKEERRLATYEFPQERRVRTVKVTPAERKVESTGVWKTVEEAEQAYADRDLAKAKEGYLRVLQETADKPLHGRAYFGLARIAALEKDPELAQRLFVRTLDAAADPQIRAWSMVYLGRLADLAGEREEAGRHYQAALAVQGASPAARKAAEEGLQESFKKD